MPRNEARIWKREEKKSGLLSAQYIEGTVNNFFALPKCWSRYVVGHIDVFSSSSLPLLVGSCSTRFPYTLVRFVLFLRVCDAIYMFGFCPFRVTGCSTTALLLCIYALANLRDTLSLGSEFLCRTTFLVNWCRRGQR